MSDGEVSQRTLEPLDPGHVLSWSLRIGRRSTTFAPQGPRLCHPVALAGLIEQNLDGFPGRVVVEVLMVGGRTVRSFDWPTDDPFTVLEEASSIPDLGSPKVRRRTVRRAQWFVRAKDSAKAVGRRLRLPRRGG